VVASQRQPVAHLYARISNAEQRKGGGLERQTSADTKEFVRRFDFQLSKHILVDDGVSAWKGLNATPRHALGRFLVDARKGLVPRGDCLLVENYDRISRQDPWAAIALVSELRGLGIHVGRLDRMKLLRHDSTDPGDFFEAAVEFMRGNSESEAKSMRNKAKWVRRRQAARDGKGVLTRRLPAWVQEEGGKLALVPDRAAAVRLIFDLAGSGYGLYAIVRRLTEAGVPSFGKSGRWQCGYLDLILKDRRALGELQPCGPGGNPDGEPIKDYFPRVVSDDAWAKARMGAQGRHRRPGRVSAIPNVFAGLLKGARDGESYTVATEAGHAEPFHVIVSTAPRKAAGRNYSFPLRVFEAAVFSLLREIDPHTILNGDQGPDETLALAGQLAEVEASITAIEADMDEHGESPTLFRRLRTREEQKRDLNARLADAREKAAHPLSEGWGEAQSILGALAAAPDPREARLRLRTALRRIVSAIWLLVVPRGKDRLCAVQMVFAESNKVRHWLILNRRPVANAASRTEGGWAALSLAAVVKVDGLDLRRPEGVQALLAALERVDLSAVELRPLPA
jgi:DNA invertase Pin-like site-specific DNA recombinase